MAVEDVSSAFTCSLVLSRAVGDSRVATFHDRIETPYCICHTVTVGRSCASDVVFVDGDDRPMVVGIRREY